MPAKAKPNRRKLWQRELRLHHHKEYPLLNLWILIMAVLELFGQLCDFEMLKVLKPVPLALMFVYIRNKSSHRNHLITRLIQAGLLISVLDDITRMAEGEQAAFILHTFLGLCTSLLYALGFNEGDRVRDMSASTSLWVALAICTAVAVHGSVLYIAWDGFSVRIVLVLSSIAGLIMLRYSFIRYHNTSPYSYSFISFGTVCLSVSDNLLLIKEFTVVVSEPWGEVCRGVVMMLHYTGHYFIMHGSLHHSNMLLDFQKYYESREKSSLKGVRIQGDEGDDDIKTMRINGQIMAKETHKARRNKYK